MNEAEVIERAVAVIGEGREDDYILAPSKQAQQLKDDAPALARLLSTAKLETYTKQYERHDRAAGEAQARFKTAMVCANGAVLATGLLGALIMAATILGTLYFADLMPAILLVLGVAALISGAAASMWLFRVREGQMLDDWMGERAHAESARLAYFATLAQLGDSTPEPSLRLLKLEYFRRYQLDMQIAYYDQRRKQHRRSADRTLAIGGFAAAAAAVASGSAGIVAFSNTPWASLAALGVVGTALAAYAATREAFNQDRRNAERYGRTLQALEILRAKLDEVRHAVLTTSAQAQDALDEYVTAVHEQLSLEHREWLSGAESTRSAIGKLDETLAELQKEPSGQH